MKYLCLVYFEPKIWETMSKSEHEALDKESPAYDKQIEQSGHYIIAEALQSVSTATTVRMRNGKISTTDGPFAETKEVLGGFILINARDLDDAIQVAGHIPLARYGSVEVRPIYDFPQQ
jgi:hypothetical protein